MVYSDLLFFLGLLPCTVLLSFLDRSTEYKNLILVITSVIFFTWAVPAKVCLLFVTIIFEYIFGLGIAKTRENRRPAAAAILAADFLMNAGVFLVFAHNYLFDSIDALHFSKALIPIGVSFYTVRGFSYCYDVFKGKCKAEKNIFCLLVYMISYHFMLVGPVVRYGDIEPAIRNRTVTGKGIRDGLNRFIIGLAKAVLIANVFSRMKLAGLNSQEITLIGCWFGMIAFFAEIYFLFTGMSDMAWGLGRMNGFDYPKNYSDMGISGLFGGLLKTFNTTLVNFFEEVFSDIAKDRKVLSVICTVFCCIAVAMWYDCRLNFIIVGAAVGIIAALEKYVYGKKLEKAPAAVRFIYILILCVLLFGGLYFSSLYGYRKWLLALVGVGTKYSLSVAMKYAVLNNITLILIAFVSVCPAIRKPLMSAVGKYAERSPRAYGQVRILKTVLSAATLLLCIITIAARLTAA
ncbi:MAG: acyltransferase [Oscillospiraceae bacterium]